MPLDVVNDMRSMDAGGVPRAEIARRLGVSRNTVAKYAGMEDLSPEPPRRREPDAGQRVHGACRCAMYREGLRVGYCP